MYSQSDLEDAVAGGAVTAEQAASLRNFVAARNGTPSADEEHVRMQLGFNDLYVYISSILLVVGLAWVGSKIEIGLMPNPLPALLIALAAWGLAEYFSRRKHLALPGIAFAAAFVLAVFATISLTGISAVGASNAMDSVNYINALSALIAAGAAFLYWKRFDEPIAVSLAVGMAAMAIMFLLGATISPDPGSDLAEIVLLILGLIVFVYAMFWDGRDTRRVTKRADTGFWLHWTSAWMVIIALAALLKLHEGAVSVVISILTIVLFLVFTLVALAVGRRVWVLAAAYPLGVGIFWLIQGPPPEMDDFDTMGGYGGGASEYGGSYGGGYGGGSGSSYGSSMQDNVMLTVLIVGLLLVLIGMFWSQIRRMIVGMLPQGLRARVPGTDQVDAAQARTFA
ncbi:MAG TPA: hypothetical protein VEX35_02310 [Allosphingosinicella sp.]|nr:hypothetical protein [Allosphingosinicella sp.]